MLLTGTGCVAPEPGAVSAAAISSAVVYGENDLEEYFEIGTEPWRERMRQSALAMIDPQRIQFGSAGEPELSLEPHGDVDGLCPGEPWFEQPAPAQCSAVLIDDNLALTAAHCVGYVPCARWRLVFGFYYDAPDQLHPLHGDDVYSCAEVVTKNYASSESALETDFAVIRLDRAVGPDRAPAEIGPLDEPMSENQLLVVIGHPAGLPAKLDAGSRVTDPRERVRDHFVANPDTFHGSSGSGVYDQEGRLRGVFGRGGEDYETTVEGCQRIRYVSDDPESASEKITYIGRVIDDLCATQTRTSLCPNTPSTNGCSVSQLARNSRSSHPTRMVWSAMLCLLLWRGRRHGLQNCQRRGV